jgi:leucyl-tRNA synthetase
MTGARVWEEPWPVADAALLVGETQQIAVQVNGKLRDTIEAPAGASNEELERLARESTRVAGHLEGRDAVKVIVVAGRLVNFVVR